MSIGKLSLPRLFPFHRPDPRHSQENRPRRNSIGHALDLHKARSGTYLYSERPF